MAAHCYCLPSPQWIPEEQMAMVKNLSVAISESAKIIKLGCFLLIPDIESDLNINIFVLQNVKLQRQRNLFTMISGSEKPFICVTRFLISSSQHKSAERAGQSKNQVGKWTGSLDNSDNEKQILFDCDSILI